MLCGSTLLQQTASDLLAAAEDLEPGEETRLLQIVSLPVGRDQTMAIGDEDMVTAIDRGLVRGPAEVG